jgi:BirA family biotin operon repressor/biotin-[acetyl-CoA-carboxylase] ligase
MPYHPDDLPPDFADAFANLRGRLGHFGSPPLFFSSVDSTNDVARQLVAAGQHGAVVIADAQTAGRGRRGRTWFSPPAAGLYVSVAIDLSPARVRPDRVSALMTLAAGVAIAEGVQRITGLSAEIKWPNDLLVGRRKLAGILAEAVADDSRRAIASIVLGYGINVRPAAYPPELRDRATSLETELGRPIDRAALCAETLAAVAERSNDLVEGRFDAILDGWRRRAPASAGARVSWQTPAGAQSGVTAGIDDWGALLVQTPQGIERLVAGEVNWV